MSGRRTRTELLIARAQLELARQGQSLLEHKRDALLREVHVGMRRVDEDLERLDASAELAQLALTEAELRHGCEPVAAAASAGSGRATAELFDVTVMGATFPAVAAPDPRRRAGERGRDPLSAGVAVELAAERFESELALAIGLASVEARVRGLAREARQTSRRVNALRFRVVPSLQAEVRTLAFTLEQREREDRFRMKLMKRRRATRPRILAVTPAEGQGDPAGAPAGSGIG